VGRHTYIREMYIYIYICLCIYIHAYIYRQTYTNDIGAVYEDKVQNWCVLLGGIYVRTDMYICVHVYIYILYTHICICVCIHVYMYIRIDTYTYIYIHIYINIYIYMQTSFVLFIKAVGSMGVCCCEFKMCVILGERWGAGVEYHFQEI